MKTDYCSTAISSIAKMHLSLETDTKPDIFNCKCKSQRPSFRNLVISHVQIHFNFQVIGQLLLLRQCERDLQFLSSIVTQTSMNVDNDVVMTDIVQNVAARFLITSFIILNFEVLGVQPEWIWLLEYLKTLEKGEVSLYGWPPVCLVWIWPNK